MAEFCVIEANSYSTFTGALLVSDRLIFLSVTVFNRLSWLGNFPHVFVTRENSSKGKSREEIAAPPFARKLPPSLQARRHTLTISYIKQQMKTIEHSNWTIIFVVGKNVFTLSRYFQDFFIA